MHHILPKTPSTVWQIVKHWAALLPVVVYHNIFNFIMVIILGLLMGFFAQMNTPFGWIQYAICLLGNLYFFSCFLYKADIAFLGRDIHYKETLVMMGKRFPRFFLVCFISYLVALVFMIPAFFFIISATGGNSALLLVSFIFIALGVWVLFYIIFVMPLIVMDDEKVFHSFKQSFLLVKGHWWRNFFVFLIVGIIIAIIDAVVTAILNLFPAGIAVELIYTMIMNVISIIAATAILLVQFNDLKIRYAAVSRPHAVQS